MSKYVKLAEHLASLNATQWRASFKEIEGILGFSLPLSARKYQAWWANENGGTHTQSQGWLGANWRTSDLDLSDEKVTFSNKKPANPPSDAREISPKASSPDEKAHFPAQGLSIAQAKAGLALFYGVSEKQIEIIIKG